MNWTAESAASLARYDCRICGGAGIDPLAPAATIPPAAWRTGDFIPCACVCRAVFQSCYRRFRRCAAASASTRAVSFNESRQGVDRHLVWVRRMEDYCADFEAAAKRALPRELLRVFRYYHVLGGSARLCARRVGLQRTQFFCLLAEVEQRVGREMALMKPYSVYPPHEYMDSRPHAGAR